MIQRFLVCSNVSSAVLLGVAALAPNVAEAGCSTTATEWQFALGAVQDRPARVVCSATDPSLDDDGAQWFRLTLTQSRIDALQDAVAEGCSVKIKYGVSQNVVRGGANNLASIEANVRTLAWFWQGPGVDDYDWELVAADNVISEDQANPITPGIIEPFEYPVSADIVNTLSVATKDGFSVRGLDLATSCDWLGGVYPAAEIFVMDDVNYTTYYPHLEFFEAVP